MEGYFNKSHGFTLVELIVVIIIVMILVSSAVFISKSYIERSRLAEAKSALLENSIFLNNLYEKKYTYKINNNWPNLPIVDTKYYIIRFSSEEPRKDRYILQAMPNSDINKSKYCLKINQYQVVHRCELISDSDVRCRNKCIPF